VPLAKHRVQAKALAELLLSRRQASLKYGATDPRHGIPSGDDEGRDGVTVSATVPCVGRGPLVCLGVSFDGGAMVGWRRCRRRC